MQQELETTWKAVQAELREAVTDSTFHIWLEPLKPVAIEGDRLYVIAPDSIGSWVEERYLGLISAAARRALPELQGAAIVSSAEAEQVTGLPSEGRRAARALNPKYTFDQFVIGDGNRFAHAAALAIAESPGQAYNPLFLYGGPGTGKTHLLQAVAWYVGVHGLGLDVHYTTVEAFTAQFVSAIRSGGMEDFKARHRESDVMLIDDVQFLANKRQTQEEFFHTIDVLHDRGSQVVLSSDRPPRELGALEERLRTRFEWGLITGLEPPDLQARVAILQKQAAWDEVTIEGPAVLELIAARMPGNVRALEGAFVRVLAYASLVGRSIDAELAERVLADLYPHRESQPVQLSIDAVKLAVGEELDISTAELEGRGRTARVVQARQIAMYLARELTSSSTPAIGRRFGDRDHSTVIHAIQKVENAARQDPHTLHLLTNLRSRLRQPGADRVT